jgi:DNA-binding NtrC family response regulator
VQGREENTDDSPRIRILIIEDNEGDAELIRRLLSKADNIFFDTEHAELMSSGVTLLEKQNFDLILSDLGLPDSVGVETLVKLHCRYPDIPMIVLTGLNDENTALAAVQRGAQDYLIKGQINTSQLIRSIRYAMERQKLITELEKRLKEIKTLQGLLPMCAWCKNIRDDKGYWKNLEAYIKEHSDAEISHGICPKCVKKVYPELYEEIQRENPAILGQEIKPDEKQQPEGPG